MEHIIIKYLGGEATEAEKKQLSDWIQNQENREKFRDMLKREFDLKYLTAPIDEEKAFKNVFKKIQQDQIKNQKLFHLYSVWMKYAAVFAGILIIGSIFILSNSKTPKLNVPPQITLELEDGTKRAVKGSGSEIIRQENGIEIEQNQNKLTYTAEGNKGSGEIRFNTLSIPYGRQYTLSLADGTEVILDAGTKIKYPVSFVTGENREVYLEGQAFFKVAEDSTRPFLVKTEHMEVRVLGTQFNISAYPKDTRTSAVLVSGSIAATFTEEDNPNSCSVMLEPGERALVENGKMEINYVNVEKYIAWTSGGLTFFNENFASIAKKLERRYNVKIINKYPVLENIRITGNFRTETIEQVLKTFQKHTSFQFKIKNDTVTLTSPNKE